MRPPGAARRILIVGMHTSVHVMRWLRMIERPDAAVLVFPVSDAAENRERPGLRSIALADVSRALDPGLWVVRSTDIRTHGDSFIDWLHGYRPWRHASVGGLSMAAPQRLARCIERFAPHLVHSMEIQLAGYLCLETARRVGPALPPWILSNWGSDIALFRKLAEHQRRLRAVCRRMDYYLAECRRDQQVARDHGYRGPTLPVIPASGGMDVGALAARARLRPSTRRTLLVKGYHGWSGRSLIALSAIALAHKHLHGYRIEVPLASAAVAPWVAQLRAHFGLDIQIAPYFADHDHAIDRLAEARAVVGVGISDGISTTLLEAMAVGAFPIQSSSACADEWVEHGRSGFVVSPHDTTAIAEAIVHAVSDDGLVERAAPMNHATVMARWNATTNGSRVWEIYDRVSEDGVRAPAEHP
jgi:glycosyltransferase involved in cell wall biosynthesis